MDASIQSRLTVTVFDNIIDLNQSTTRLDIVLISLLGEVCYHS